MREILEKIKATANNHNLADPVRAVNELQTQLLEEIVKEVEALKKASKKGLFNKAGGQ